MKRSIWRLLCAMARRVGWLFLHMAYLIYTLCLLHALRISGLSCVRPFRFLFFEKEGNGRKLLCKGKLVNRRVFIKLGINSSAIANEIQALSLLPNDCDFFLKPVLVKVKKTDYREIAVIVLPWMEGARTISDYLIEGAPLKLINPNKLLHVIRGASEMIDILHSLPRPLLHCDISSNNLLVRSDGHLCLIDWDDAYSGTAKVDYSRHGTYKQFVSNGIVFDDAWALFHFFDPYRDYLSLEAAEALERIRDKIGFRVATIGL